MTIGRRRFTAWLAGAAATPFVLRALTMTREGNAMTEHAEPTLATGQEVEKLDKPDEEWRGILEPDAYEILFDEKTERPGSSPLNGEKRDGTFICAACFLPLFPSSTRFESGTGWPSFYQPIAGHVETKKDFKLIIPRTEYHCARCGGHQGHVFKDGPEPTGLRYCNNGRALRFVAEDESLPELRS